MQFFQKDHLNFALSPRPPPPLKKFWNGVWNWTVETTSGFKTRGDPYGFDGVYILNIIQSHKPTTFRIWHITFSKNLQFSTNGLITFERPYIDWTPSPFTSFPLLAVYWTDLYPLGSNGAYVFYQTNDPSALSKATTDVRNFAGIPNFEAKWVLVVTWWETPFYHFTYGQVIFVAENKVIVFM